MAKGNNIFRRYELKHLISKEQYEELLKRVKEYTTEDEYGESTIFSLYYDTPDRLLIRRSIEHPDYKEKLRVRSYGVAVSDTKVYIELKKKYNGVVYKRRVSMKNDDAIAYLSGAEAKKQGQIVEEIDYFKGFYKNIEPAMLLSYDRRALYGKNENGLRITFDRNILYRDTDLNLKSGAYGTQVIDSDQTLMEIKALGSMPLWLVNILSELKIYKTSFSKYGNAYKMSMAKEKKGMKNCG